MKSYNVIRSFNMYGRKAVQLFQDFAPSAEDGKIGQFNNDLVEQVFQEANEHYLRAVSCMEKIQEKGLDIETTKNEDHYGAIIHHASLLRNKRCLMAYMYSRAQTIQRLRWKLGPVFPDEVQQNLNYSEKDFLKGYSDAIASYFEDIDMDLTVDTAPPKDPYIKVRVVKSVGDVLLEEQAASLTRNSIHMVKRAEVETLISQGIMEELTI